MRIVKFSSVVALLLVAACGGETAPAGNTGSGGRTRSAGTKSSAPKSSTTTSASAAAPASASGSASGSASTAKVDWPAIVKKHGDEVQAAFTAKDPAKFAALYTADATIASIGRSGFEESKVSEAADHMKEFWTAFPDMKMAAIRILIGDGVAVVEWASEGTHKATFMGIEATQKKVGYRGANVMWFDPSGKVKKERVYNDPMNLMGQLGKLPKEAKTRAAEALLTGAPEIVTQTGNESKTEATCKSFFDAMMKKDTKGALAALTDDYLMSAIYMPADSKGRAAQEKEFTESAKAFADDKVEIVGCYTAGDFMACETSWTATLKGEFMGMKPTNKTGTVHGLDVHHVKDGKIDATYAYGSGLEFATAFGLDGGAAPAGSGSAAKSAAPAAPPPPAPPAPTATH